MSTQTERHEEAFRLWRVLENLGESEWKSRLEDEESDFYTTPTSAMLTLYIFNELSEDENTGIEVDEKDRLVFWEKLFGRSVGKVWLFCEYAKTKRPEHFAGLISDFAKKYKVIEEAA